VTIEIASLHCSISAWFPGQSKEGPTNGADGPISRRCQYSRWRDRTHG